MQKLIQRKVSTKKQKVVTTDYDCRLLPDPNSNVELTRIPKNTELVVLESKREKILKIAL